MARIDLDEEYSLKLRLPRRKPTPPAHVRPPRFCSRKRLPGHALSRARGAGATAWTPTPQLQRSTVKASYATSGKTPWKAHGSYLAREGAQREGEKGRGFTAEREDIDLEQTLAQWQNAGDRHHFRFIVSPEQATRLDLRQHARDVVKQMEKDLGTQLEWVAIDHHNTAHPHVHVLIRGRDESGNTLVIAREYIREGMRTRSQELATQQLGYRLEHDILAAREQAIKREQFTEIDRALLRRADADWLVSFEDPVPRDADRQERRLQEIRRLQFLTTLGLAEKVGSKTWRMAEHMEQTLRALQLQTDIIKTRARHQQQLSNPTAPVTATSVEPGMVVRGKLVGTGLADELTDRRYLLLETADGQLHYLIQPASVQRARGEGTLRIGDQITLTGKAFTKNGRAISYVELTMEQERERSFPTLETVRAREAKPVEIEEPRSGAHYRGRLLTYATGPEGEQYAVIDTGRQLRALRTEQNELTEGREVLARGREVMDEDNRRTRLLVWRLDDAERERAQQQERSQGHTH